MKEYREAGFPEQESEEHKNYNEIVKKLRKAKEQTKPEPEKPDPEKPDPEKPDPEKPDIEPNRNLPIRSFWEIYNDTCTEHVGSIAHNINKIAHMKLLPSKNEDTLHKILNLPLTVFRAPMKLLAQIPNSLMRTDRKIAQMAENIDNLGVEEFQVLVQSPEKVNKMFGKVVKENIDRDYLDPQFMKQYKVNNAYLDVVRARLGRERGEAINLYNAQATSAYNRLNELEEIGKENWTQEQRDEYNREVAVYQKSVEEGKKCVAELAQFDEGAKKKSSAYRNISGWFLAKFNPDNREANGRMAELSKARREAVAQGKENEANEYTKKMQDELRNNTKLVGGERNYVDKAGYSFQGPIELLNKGPQTKGRLLLSNFALITAWTRFVTQVKEHIANNKIIQSHNQQLEQVNRNNTNMEVKGEAKVSDSLQAKTTEETISKQTIEAGWNNAERGNLSKSNWDISDSTYKQNDVQSHAEAAEVSNNATTLINDGKQLEALKAATDYYKKVQTNSDPSISAHVARYTDNDYTAFEFGDGADMSKVYEFFANGTVPYSTNITATMAEMLPKIKDGVDLNGVIFASVNALYQAQKEATRSEKRNIRDSIRVNQTNNENEQVANEENQVQNENER